MQFSGPEKLGSILNVLTIQIINHSFYYTFFCFKISATLAAKFSDGQLTRLAPVVSTSHKSMTEIHNRVQPVLVRFFSPGPTLLGRNGAKSSLIVTNLDRVRLELRYLISI